MAARKMLRDLMNVPDIYAQADSISQMLREDYGGYDADVFDEVLVEESFAQRLAARGYDVRPWNADAASASSPVARPAGDDVVPVQIVRRSPGAAPTRSAAPAAPRPATQAASTAAPAPTPERSRSTERSAPAEEPTAPATRSTGTRGTGTRSTTRASSGTTGTRSTGTTRARRAITSDADQLSAEPSATPTRARRTRTARSTESDES